MKLRSMSKPSFPALLMATLCLCTSLSNRASGSDADHLVPVEKALGTRAAYGELWQQKLLLTPGEVARFVGLPGTVGVETAVSVYRTPGKKDSLAGNYWVTATQASERLWNCVERPGERKVDSNTIHIERCDAPIAKSTAIAVHKVWLAMLSQARPARHSNEIVLDSSREIFSATDSQGNVLQAESSTDPQANSRALIDIALTFLEYCGAPVEQRMSIAHKIEREASNLLKRLERSNAGRQKKISRKRNGI